MSSDLSGSELGHASSYDEAYNPSRLLAIPRTGQRQTLGLTPHAPLPFFGFDAWTHYEVSWLNLRGKPLVAIADIAYDCASPCIVESKSLKLYFNSLNNTSFASMQDVEMLIQQDLSQCLQTPVSVTLRTLDASGPNLQPQFLGESLDHLDIECTDYTVTPAYLYVEEDIVSETLHSDLLRSNCLVTHQPDWGSVQIAYQGKKINREGLLKYLISFRNHHEFHEHCIERIFMDLQQHCAPTQLTVYGRYTRRGGLDINPYRSSEKNHLASNLAMRLVRQ